MCVCEHRVLRYTETKNKLLDIFLASKSFLLVAPSGSNKKLKCRVDFADSPLWSVVEEEKEG